MEYLHTTIFLGQLKEDMDYEMSTHYYISGPTAMNYPQTTIFLGQLKEDVDYGISTHYISGPT